MYCEITNLWLGIGERRGGGEEDWIFLILSGIGQTLWMLRSGPGLLHVEMIAPVITY